MASFWHGCSERSDVAELLCLAIEFMSHPFIDLATAFVEQGQQLTQQVRQVGTASHLCVTLSMPLALLCSYVYVSPIGLILHHCILTVY